MLDPLAPRAFPGSLHAIANGAPIVGCFDSRNDPKRSAPQPLSG
ncbi:MAG: hypothetical protein AW07_03152 [Candidatus Accumulibacter sp. SK-11]|nr:MAG: hypothetical protein AW07_03152 [Candidatus Accumulibacter sp. SK-11]